MSGTVDYEAILDDLRKRKFDDYPPCNFCGSTKVSEKLVTKDHCNIVECTKCGLCFMSPRFSEKRWESYLKCLKAPKNKTIAENRINHGVAHLRNKPFKGWRDRLQKKHFYLIEQVENEIGRSALSLHDVGCGVGFLVQDALKRGIQAYGNDLNACSCQSVQKHFNITIHNKNLNEVQHADDSLDIIVMKDYLEHSYHPYSDLLESYRILDRGGGIYIRTFHIDCQPFVERGKDWNMLFWNHVYQFPLEVLKNMVQKAGFTIKILESNNENGIATIIAVKDGS
jgi:2-polyprenyl-3-methyl-5-hydroxy-6-metoxy-1,4-benzoquinol methylase